MPRRRISLLAWSVLPVAVLVAAWGACTPGRPDVATGDITVTSNGADAPGERAAPATDPQPAAPKRSATISINVAGDVHFEEELRPRLADPNSALEPIAAVLGDADLTIVNLETAITRRGVPEPKTYHFRVPPVALDALAAAGVDVVSMANNHAVDYGKQGLADTLAAADDSPIPVVGVGADAAAAFSPAVFDVEGTSVAFLAATQVPDRTASAWPAAPGRAGVAAALEPTRLVDAVKRAASRNDVVVVYLHYGAERVACPIWAQKDLVGRLVDAGADAVVGSHAHVLLGAGWLGNSYVSYGMGNFVWYSPNSVREASSGVLHLTVRRSDGRVIRDDMTPTFTGQDGLPRQVDAAAARNAVKTWRELRGCAGLARRPPA